jgi:5'(3')-deoxyribonucleotidase
VRIYVDLDGTVCDIKKAVEEFRSRKEYEEESLIYKYPWSSPGFFSNLDPIEKSVESVFYLSDKYDVWFLSRPSFRNIESYSDKARWVRNVFGYDFQKKLILCGDKSLLKGRILIDDEENAGQSNFAGIWIRIFSDDYPNWDKVIKRVEEIGELPINSL